jgi:hypothetical protein
VSAFPPRPDAPEPGTERPAWRRSSFGWLLLHLAIGIALAVGLIWLELGAMASMGRDLLRLQNVPTTDTAMLRASAIAVITATVGGFGGWMLFVYLRASKRARVWWLAAGLGGAFAIALAFFMPLLPAIP